MGAPLSRAQTRRLLALRINVLAKGYSGIRPETVAKMVAAFNLDCLSVVPSQGTVGASGDLAPLAHLALGLMGEGQMWDPHTGEQAPAAAVLANHGLAPIQLEAKEGLAMINGTQLMSSIAAEAVTRAATLAYTADVACALSVEALKGTPRAFEACIHATRPHKGQQAVAARLMKLLTPVSEVRGRRTVELYVEKAWKCHALHLSKIDDSSVFHRRSCLPALPNRLLSAFFESQLLRESPRRLQPSLYSPSEC